jgi:hypothetical protein
MRCIRTGLAVEKYIRAADVRAGRKREKEHQYCRRALHRLSRNK